MVPLRIVLIGARLVPEVRFGNRESQARKALH